MGKLDQPLIRNRRDFFRAADECSDEWGSEMRECMCRHGEQSYCRDWEETFGSATTYSRTVSTTAIIVIIATAVGLLCACLFCICRRRRTLGAVFRTPSGRTVTTTTVIQQPPVTQPAGGAVSRSYPTQPQTWAPPGQGGFPQPPAGYTPPQPQTGYPPQPQPQPGYPPQPQGGYQAGYPPQPQGGYPQPQGGYPQPQGGYPPQPGFAHAPPPSAAADLPPPYDAAAGRQPPYNPNYQEGGDTKRPL